MQLGGDSDKKMAVIPPGDELMGSTIYQLCCGEVPQDNLSTAAKEKIVSITYFSAPSRVFLLVSLLLCLLLLLPRLPSSAPSSCHSNVPNSFLRTLHSIPDQLQRSEWVQIPPANECQLWRNTDGALYGTSRVE